MDNMLEKMIQDLDAEIQYELDMLKIQWEGVKLKAEKAKRDNPELAEEIDNYVQMIKDIGLKTVLKMCDSEEEKQEIKNFEKYIFGEDYDVGE